MIKENEEHKKINGELREKVKKLEEENKIFALEGSKVRLSLYIKENYIPKQKIKNELKKYEWAINDYDSSIADYKQSQAIGRWAALQELLQEEDK